MGSLVAKPQISAQTSVLIHAVGFDIHAPEYFGVSMGLLVVGLRGLILRRTILNRTYGPHKKLPGMYFYIFTGDIWSSLLWPPVTV